VAGFRHEGEGNFNYTFQVYVRGSNRALMTDYLLFTFIVPCIIVIVSKNNQHDVTCGLSFIFIGSRHSFYMFRPFGKLIISSSFFPVQSASGIVCSREQKT